MIREKNMKKKWVEFLLPESKTEHPDMILRIDVAFLDDCDDMKADALMKLEGDVEHFFIMRMPEFYFECGLDRGFSMSLYPPNEYRAGWKLFVWGINECRWFSEPPRLDRHSISV